MKHVPLILGITAIMLLTACGGQGQDDAWYEENCEVRVADVREKFEHGEPTGEVIGRAMTQGPIKPPAALDDSAHERFGLYISDELSGAMELQREVSASDVFCLEPGIADPDRRVSIDTREHDIEGDLHGDVYEADFTLLRSEEYPEGIWVGIPISALPSGIEITEDMPEQCNLQWWPAGGIDYDSTTEAEGDIAGTINKQENC